MHRIAKEVRRFLFVHRKKTCAPRSDRLPVNLSDRRTHKVAVNRLIQKRLFHPCSHLWRGTGGVLRRGGGLRFSCQQSGLGLARNCKIKYAIDFKKFASMALHIFMYVATQMLSVLNQSIT